MDRPGKPIVALDFDGVLCDSARETALSAWRAGAVYWPEWDRAAASESQIGRFIQLRPHLETGYQSVLIMRMIADGRITDALTVLSLQKAWFCLYR